VVRLMFLSPGCTVARCSNIWVLAHPDIKQVPFFWMIPKGYQAAFPWGSPIFY
jgi:hypothetical protein